MDARDLYIHEIEKIFHESDAHQDGKINRHEFEKLIRGYFELKGIKSTKENFDTYFNKLDINHDHTITLENYIEFMDKVIDNDILPFLTEQL